MEHYRGLYRAMFHQSPPSMPGDPVLDDILHGQRDGVGEDDMPAGADADMYRNDLRNIISRITCR